eukprot:1016646-Amorphochlora_amoeboformis.AAC.1
MTLPNRSRRPSCAPESSRAGGTPGFPPSGKLGEEQFRSNLALGLRRLEVLVRFLVRREIGRMKGIPTY